MLKSTFTSLALRGASRIAVAAAVASTRAPQLTANHHLNLSNYRCTTGCSSSSSFGSGVLVCARRAQHSSNNNANEPDSDEAIIARCKWNSDNMSERLGFRDGQVVTEELLKRHFIILAKHFHPDNPNAPPRATEAFQHIKEAQDVASARVKHQGQYRAGDVGGFQYADENRRRGQMRMLGDSIILFMIMTLLFVYLVTRHNKDRLYSRYLSHFLGIFLIIQFLPRLLAAAFLFAWHASDLADVRELKERAAVTLIVRPDSKKGVCDVTLSGISEESVANVVVQVEVDVAGKHTSQGASTVTTSTTLTFDAGVTTFTVPCPPSGSAQNATTYHVRAVDEKRKFVLADKSFSL